MREPDAVSTSVRSEENPDGTDILFNTDYLGNHRGLNVLPGPFADKESSGKELF